MRVLRVIYGLFVIALAGCEFFVPQTGSGGGGTNTGNYIYVGNGNNRFLAGFEVSSSGVLSVLTNSPYNNGVAAIAMAITPSNSFLYAGTISGIFVYAINSNWSIVVQNGGAVAAQDVLPTVMQVDSTGGVPTRSERFDLVPGPGNWYLSNRCRYRIVDAPVRLASRDLHWQVLDCNRVNTDCDVHHNQ